MIGARLRKQMDDELNRRCRANPESCHITGVHFGRATAPFIKRCRCSFSSSTRAKTNWQPFGYKQARSSFTIDRFCLGVQYVVLTSSESKNTNSTSANVDELVSQFEDSREGGLCERKNHCSSHGTIRPCKTSISWPAI